MLHRGRIFRPLPPWEHEGDRYEFTYAGLRCLILRHPEHGQLNGYVGVTEKHPWYGKYYNGCLLGCAGDPPNDPIFKRLSEKHQYKFYGCIFEKNHCSPESVLRVHGGITFTQSGDGKLWPAGYYWYGFDTAHAWDFSPYLEKKLSELIPNHKPLTNDPNVSYKTLYYVWQEVEALATQLSKIQRFKLLMPVFYRVYPYLSKYGWWQRTSWYRFKLKFLKYYVKALRLTRRTRIKI